MVATARPARHAPARRGMRLTQRVSAAVTAGDKRLLDRVARAAKRSLSELLYDHSIRQLLATGRQLPSRRKKNAAGVGAPTARMEDGA